MAFFSKEIGRIGHCPLDPSGCVQPGTDKYNFFSLHYGVLIVTLMPQFIKIRTDQGL